MDRLLAIAAALWLASAWVAPASAQTAATVEKLYVLDCGHGRGSDQSRWSPGVNVGVPLDVRDNCYLIRHAQGWFLWDTGVPDAVARMPDGLVSPLSTWKRPKTLAEQMQQVGVPLADVKWVGISHTHGDHVGNVDLFAGATVLMQKAEYDWSFAPTKTFPFSADRTVRKLEGDLDVFGDGSARILSTPGHTPGHQCLLVHLKNTGYVLLSGDAVHFKDNWENRRVPAMNTSKDQTVASMQRIADTLAQYKAELWINHDKAQGDAAKRPPEFYD
ncbi:MAG: N-acyl homoserine lactonase family protein [Alphaproteobacteria bacterium]|nr:N-acyl homoserine lactonase family protein [Alphaproteobacteria bacterium]